MDIRRLSQRARIRIGLLSVAILRVAVVVAALLPRPTPIVAPVAPHVPIAFTSRLIAGSSVVGIPVVVAGHALGTAPLAALELWAGGLGPRKEHIDGHRSHRPRRPTPVARLD